MNKSRGDVVRRSLEAEDLMAASMVVGPAPSSNASTKGLGLECVKLQGKLNTEVEKAPIETAGLEKTAFELIKKIESQKDDTNDANIQKLLADSSSAKQGALSTLQARKSDLQDLLAKMGNIASVSDAKTMEKSMLSLNRNTAKADTLKTWRALLTKCNAWLDQLHRQQAQVDQPLADAGSERATKKGLLLTRLGGHANVGSLFEAKAALKVAKCAPITGQDPIGSLQKLPFVKSALKLVRAHHASGSPWGVFPVTDEPKMKRLDKVLNTGHDVLMMSHMILPKDLDWAPKVYVKHVFGACADWAHIGMSHMCCMEVRVLFSGREAVLGFPFDEISGASMRDKRAWIVNASADGLTNLAKNGFAVTHDQTEAIVIPTGFMLSYFAHELCLGMRWSITSDQQDTHRVRRLLRELMNSFRELAQPSAGHIGFRSFLED